MENKFANYLISQRFRGYYPVVIDVETGGLEAKTDALLELAAVTINCTPDGKFVPYEKVHAHIKPFEGASLYPASLAVNGIDPYHPFRFAIEEKDALTKMFKFLRVKQQKAHCHRCVLVGHNAWFDLSFMNAAIKRTKVKKNPFHAFTCFDTATLSGLVYGQTVLAQAMKAANITFDISESHSAIYDAEKTAELFCHIVNQWPWRYRT